MLRKKTLFKVTRPTRRALALPILICAYRCLTARKKALQLVDGALEAHIMGLSDYQNLVTGTKYRYPVLLWADLMFCSLQRWVKRYKSTMLTF
jgi:uncharacterized protein YaiE (UPF0345 family)